ncbi:MAG TPA: hypothetical protein VMU54_12490 [Planctomycetota bacterium]|nr:hypothetical protein [Planctomycetota bacterium]
MKLKQVTFLASVLALAACGVGKQEGEVRFSGFAPVNSKDKDVREVRTFCPGCGEPIAVDTARCPNKRCKTEMSWRADYRCPSCKGSGYCSACSEMEQAKGDCYNCKGQGVLIFQGQSPECPNCKGTKKCPICKGSMKCDFCDGTGKVAKDIVKAKSAKFASGDVNELPPSDPRLPAEKKDDAPKEEPKKDAAPPETKKE